MKRAADARPLLLVNAFAAGHHEGAWRRPEAEPQRLRDIGYYQDLARSAERGGLDAMFVADFFAHYPGIAHSPRWELDPLTVLAAAASVTEDLGLIATASASFSPAVEIARAFSTLDQLSGGRAAWNIVTSGEPRAAANFGFDRVLPHAERYARAAAVVEQVLAHWLAGERGGDGMPAPAQPRPVLVQAGSSPDGRDFAARHADIVFTAQGTLAAAQAFRADLQARARALGRASPPRVVVGLSPSIGASRAEALRRKAELDALIVPEASLAWLEGFGIDLSGHGLEAALPPQLGDAAAFEGIRSRLGVIAEVIERERPRTVRELMNRLAGSRGHAALAGTPQDIADHIQRWHEGGAADGFMLMPHLLPRDLDDFVDQVVPLLDRPPRPPGLPLYRRLGLALR